MPINLNAFNQNAPQIDLANSFRQGVSAINDVYGAKRQKQALIADQFANQQAPILAQQKAQAAEQDLLNSQSSRANVADVMKYRDLENKQKTAQYLGNMFSSVTKPEDIDAIAFHIKGNPALDQSIVEHQLSYFSDPNNRTVEHAQQLGYGTIDAASQATLKLNELKAQQDALQRQADAQAKADKEAYERSFEGKKFTETQRHNKVIENKPSSTSNVILQTDNGALLVNKKTGAVKEILGAGGQSIIKDKSGKPLSGEAASKYAIGSALNDNLNELKTKMTTGDFKSNIINAKTPGSDLNRLVSDATDLLGKKRSGAALNASEEKLYSNLIANKYDVIFNDKQAFINQIERLKKENNYFLKALTGDVGSKSESKPIIQKTSSGLSYEIIKENPNAN